MCEKAAVCRTCLRADNLSPIFSRAEQHERYTVALFLTTGLQIEIDDGLPQTICAECINFVNVIIDFRNQSHRSERALLQWGRKRRSTLNKSKHKERADIDAKSSDLHNFDNSIERDGRTYKEESRLYSESEDYEVPIVFESKPELETRVWNGRTKSEWNSGIKNELSTRKFTRERVDTKKRYEHLIDGPTGGPGPYVCKVCKKVLKSWSSFRTHAKIHLGFDFMCEYCGKTFIAVTMLQRHCMSQHGAERTYRCKLCEHRALDSERLKIHERREHTGDRPYVCDACGANFLTRRNLVHHLAVHMTQRTVQCAKCPAKFKSAQHLACHTSKVHRRRDYRMQCYMCDNTYTKYENVRKHLAKIHGVPRQQQDAIRRVRVATEA